MPNLSRFILNLFFVLSLAGQAFAIDRLQVRGPDFVNEQGEQVRFWGVNLVALFPSHEQADALAENLASRQINIVRPHHLLRSSRDWIHQSKVKSLVLFDDNTRDPDPEAWDRFDYLNAKLREKGIYLALSLHFSRSFLPGDVDVLTTDDADRQAWMQAVETMRGWDWRKSIDPVKMLPTIDERACALQEEFARRLLSHVNPYTGIAYGRDAQVLTIEIVNESSAEYALICNNQFPPYFDAKLQRKWEAYAKAHGVVEPSPVRQVQQSAEKLVRAGFLRKLDEDYFLHMQTLVKDQGCEAAVTFSNLWRGENNLQMHAAHSAYIEDHAYVDPYVVRRAEDIFHQKAKTCLADKPYFIGELNQAEGGNNIRAQSPMRTMLPLAMASYGSFQNYSGLIWFAWNHGDRSINKDGWAIHPDRSSHLGDMISDMMMLDRMRTAGMIFRRGLVKPSQSPITVIVDPANVGTDYGSIMHAGTYHQPGWQSIHGIRKTYGALPEAQQQAPWAMHQPESPFITDTGEIVKDLQREQLTVIAPQAEAFSGKLDGREQSGLQHLAIGDEGGFATVIAVCQDEKPFATTRSIVISRTHLDAEHKDQATQQLALRHILIPEEGESWTVKVIRPRVITGDEVLTALDGRILSVNRVGTMALPVGNWFELELSCGPSVVQMGAND